MLRYVNLTATGEDTAFTLGKLMLAVHGYNADRAEGERIAVAFPMMQDAVISERGKTLSTGSFGPQLRLFAAEDKLSEFLVSALPNKLARLGAVVRGAITDVPAGAGAVRYVRDRKFEKTHTGGAHARRQQRRAAEQGRECVARKRLDKPVSVGLLIKSKSTDRPFHLDVRKEASEVQVSLAKVNAYGLCGEGSAVPMF